MPSAFWFIHYSFRFQIHLLQLKYWKRNFAVQSSNLNTRGREKEREWSTEELRIRFICVSCTQFAVCIYIGYCFSRLLIPDLIPPFQVYLYLLDHAPHCYWFAPAAYISHYCFKFCGLRALSCLSLLVRAQLALSSWDSLSLVQHVDSPFKNEIVPLSHCLLLRVESFRIKMRIRFMMMWRAWEGNLIQVLYTSCFILCHSAMGVYEKVLIYFVELQALPVIWLL